MLLTLRILQVVVIGFSFPAFILASVQYGATHDAMWLIDALIIPPFGAAVVAICEWTHSLGEHVLNDERRRGH